MVIAKPQKKIHDAKMNYVKDRCEKSMIMKGVNGRLEWIIYIGKWDRDDVYQCSHEWLFGT